MSLYEDRTFENLQAEALEDLREEIEELPENERVDASEGSFMYLSIAKQAVRLEEAYNDLDELNDNMLVDTQDLDHLVDSGAECGILIKEGTSAVVVAELNCPCEIGDEFFAIDSDYGYIAVEFKGIRDNEDGTQSYIYHMNADEEGLDPGNYRGEIEPEDFLDGFEEGKITDVYMAGTEEEDEEVYRERRLNSFRTTACAGNYDYYRDTVGELAGVGGVKIIRRKEGQHYIQCYLQADDYGVPTQGILDFVKETMDPLDAEGEGVGLCPFGHILHVDPVEGVAVNVTASFTFDTGYSIENMRSALTEVVKEYLTELAKTWQESGAIVVRRARIEAKLLDVTGILDIADLVLNGDEDNITLAELQIPVMGTLKDSSEN